VYLILHKKRNTKNGGEGEKAGMKKIRRDNSGGMDSISKS
jgi:hypothetical protein